MRSSVGKYDVSVRELWVGFSGVSAQGNLNNAVNERDRPKVRDEWRLDVADRVPVDASEERVVLDLLRRVPPKPRLVPDDHPACTRTHQRPILPTLKGKRQRKGGRNALANEVLALATEPDVLGEVELVLPVDDLAVRVVGVLTAEGGVPDEAFEHDGPEGPPVALLPVTLLEEDLGRDVVGGSDGRVGLTT